MPVVLNDHLKTIKRNLLMDLSGIKKKPHLEQFKNSSYLCRFVPPQNEKSF